MKYFGNAILLLVVLLLALPNSLQAQSRKYTLTGQVYDSITALPIKNAQIAVAGTNFNAIGDEKGAYKIEKLVPGTNNLIVWAEGYDTSVIKFEIRKDMALNVKLMQKLDTASLHIEDSVSVDSIKPAVSQKEVKAPKKKKVQQELSNKDKEEIRVLLEDVIFSKSIYFSKFKDKRKVLCVWGSFSIDTGYLYKFEAVFNKKDGYELKWLKFDMTGHISQ